MNQNLKQLKASVWVADLCNFRKAADQLNTTQPNIFPRIASLESALNVSLRIANVPAVMVQDDLNKGTLVVLDYACQPEDLHFLARFDAHTALDVVSSEAELAVEVAPGYLASAP